MPLRRCLLALSGFLVVTSVLGDDRPLAARRLEDPDWVVRALSARSLAASREDRGILWMRDRLERENHECAQAFLLLALRQFPLEALERVGGKPLVPAALRLLRAKSPYVRLQAAEFLKTITGEKIGADRKAWEAWWDAHAGGFQCPVSPLSPAPDGIEEATTRAASSFEDFVYAARRKGLEVVFAIDQTGSMGATLAAAKGNILEIGEDLTLLVPKCRIGLVTYDDAAQVKFPLTHEFEAVKQKLARVTAAGGGDDPEGVDKALAAALDARMGWSEGALKSVIILGDAPPHPEDVEQTCGMSAAAAKKGWAVHAIGVGMMPPEEFGRIAKAGGGSYVTAAAGSAQMVQQMLVLSLGKEHEKALSGFVDVVRAVRAASSPKP